MYKHSLLLSRRSKKTFGCTYRCPVGNPQELVNNLINLKGASAEEIWGGVAASWKELKSLQHTIALNWSQIQGTQSAKQFLAHQTPYHLLMNYPNAEQNDSAWWTWLMLWHDCLLKPNVPSYRLGWQNLESCMRKLCSRHDVVFEKEK